MNQLTIFDCDGTLVDSEVIANEVLLEAVADYGVPLTLDQAVDRFRGGKMAETVAEIEALLGHGLPNDFVPRLRDRMAAAFEARLQPVDGAVDLVKSMKGPICVASSGPMEKIRLNLSLTDLLPYFEGRIFSSYDIGSWKPDPGLLIHAARTMNVEPHDCTVIEDSLPGITAGLAAGMTVYALQQHGVHPDMPEDVVIVQRLSDLRDHAPFA